jgi:hypothetical protein
MIVNYDHKTFIGQATGQHNQKINIFFNQSNVGSDGDGSFGKSSDDSRRSQSSDGDAADEIKRER